MRLTKKFLGIVCTLGLLAMFCAVPVMAADEGYTYTVTVSAGKGSDAGESSINGAASVTEIKTYNGIINFADYTVVAPEGYELAGFHEAGDVTKYYGTEGFATVTGDEVFVASYKKAGITQDVNYTIKYVIQGTTTEIAPETTGVGSIGDVVLAKFKEVENYMPVGYNLQGELKSEGQIFYFPYVDISQETRIVTRVVDGQTIYVYEDVEETVPGGGAIDGGADDGAIDGGADDGAIDGGADDGAIDGGADDGNDDGAIDGGDTDGQDGEDVDTPDTPRDVIDVDDPDTPLDNNTIDDGSSASTLSTAAKIGIIAGAVVVAAAIIIIIIAAAKKKKKSDN